MAEASSQAGTNPPSWHDQNQHEDLQIITKEVEDFYIRLLLPHVADPNSIDLNDPNALQNIVKKIYEKLDSNHHNYNDNGDPFTNHNILFSGEEGHSLAVKNALSSNSEITIPDRDPSPIEPWLAEKLLTVLNSDYLPETFWSVNYGENNALNRLAEYNISQNSDNNNVSANADRVESRSPSPENVEVLDVEVLDVEVVDLQFTSVDSPTTVASTPLSAEPSADDPSDTQVIDSRVLDPNIRIFEDDSAPAAGRDDSLDAATPPVSSTPNTTTEAAAESPPAAPLPQPTSVAASMLPVASANATANVISFEQIPPIENPFKKTYTADRIENVGWFVHRAAGLVALGAVAAVVAAPFVTGLAMGTALVWGVGSTVATYGLGFGVNQLADIVRGFESPRVKKEKVDAADFEDLANTERKSLFREIYGPAIRGRIIGGLSPELQQQLAARQAEPPAREPAAEQPAPVAAAPAPENVAAPAPVVVEQSAPVTTVTPEPVAVVEPPEPAPVAVAAQTAPAPVAVSPRWGDSASYELLYEIDIANDVSFAGSLSINTQFSGATFVADVALGSNYKSSFTDADLVRLGFSQQRTN